MAPTHDITPTDDITPERHKWLRLAGLSSSAALCTLHAVVDPGEPPPHAVITVLAFASAVLGAFNAHALLFGLRPSSTKREAPTPWTVQPTRWCSICSQPMEPLMRHCRRSAPRLPSITLFIEWRAEMAGAAAA